MEGWNPQWATELLLDLFSFLRNLSEYGLTLTVMKK